MNGEESQGNRAGYIAAVRVDVRLHTCQHQDHFAMGKLALSSSSGPDPYAVRSVNIFVILSLW